jgi:hypothetical protein
LENFNKIFSKKEKGIVFSILFEYFDEYNQDNYKSLTKVIICNKIILNKIVNYIMYRSNFLLTEQYNDLKIKNYIISYKYIDKELSIALGSEFLKDHQNEILEKKFKLPKINLTLPLNYDIELWENIYDIKSDYIKLNNWNIIFLKSKIKMRI